MNTAERRSFRSSPPVCPAGLLFAFLSDLFPRFSSGDPSERRVDDLPQDQFGVGRKLVKVVAKLFIDQGKDHAGNDAVAQLHLRLTFKLRLGNLDRHDRREPFGDIARLQAVSITLQKLLVFLKLS